MDTDQLSPDDTAVDSECCGICTDVVIDRGVLDCCDHWFCFACIDNWATITNLCPLCKNEFQLITCLPVYDTIGNFKPEDYSLRDDDWSIQGKSNTLFFPSYYIDENAVVCLDGDGCKIRSGLSIAELDSTFDTSIACDSCDVWYHAFCVGFNPECGSSESSWLCPRCMTEKSQRKSDGVQSQNLSNSSLNADSGWLIDPSFSSKVSVSVDDDGETAVVVSFVDGQQKPDFITDTETQRLISDTSSDSAKLDVHRENSGCSDLLFNRSICSDEKGPKATPPENDQNSGIHLDIREAYLKEKLLESPSLENTVSELSVSQADKGASLTVSEAKGVTFPLCYSPIRADFNIDDPDKMISKPWSSNEAMIPSALSLDASETKNQTSESKSDISSHLDLSVSTSSADKTGAESGEDMIETLPKHIKLSDLADKPTEQIQPHVIDVDCLKNHTRKKEVDPDHPVKKAKSDGKSQLLSRIQSKASDLDNSKRFSRNAASNNENMLRNALPKKAGFSTDIMSVVKEGKRRLVDDPTNTNSKDKSTTRRENASGLRVKKIMRRGGEREESSVLVQKLREEIREAVSDKTSNSDNVSDFDAKLLTAFRAAIVKPKDELTNKSVSSNRSLKRSLLRKGKTRENLTKKIYGMSTGKRKHAWHREWEVEFWKHRCLKTKPEKVETLHSVLALLKKATDSCSNDAATGEGHEREANSILSRIYLADTSVFPRKDDIKPLSVLAGSSQTVGECSMAKNSTEISKCLPQVAAIASNNNVKRSNASRVFAEASCRKGNQDNSDSSVSRVEVQSSSKEIASLSDSSKIDKKKWALEVLARKNSSSNSSGGKGKEEDKSSLKGKYPLLAQLPVDMRPAPAHSRHNKVPVAVRQAQLYRITEHFLRRTNLPVMRRIADTELAVADAVNIEKGIFERSNSKLVYNNLCSQALSQKSNRPHSAETIASTASIPTAEVADQVREDTLSETSIRGWSNVEEALKLAGLSSDSPTNSPCWSPIKDANVEDNSNGINREQEFENVLDIDSRPELDIYGDFEYDLDDDACELSKSLQQQNKDSKLKVVFSTLRCDEPKTEHYDTKPVAGDQDSSNVKVDDSTKNGTEEIKMPPLLPKPFEGEMNEEPSLTECEELYGPENELFPNKVPFEFIGEMNKSMETVATGVIPHESENHQSQDGDKASNLENGGCFENSFVSGKPLNHGSSNVENSPAQYLASENVPMEKKEKLASNEVPDPSNSVAQKVEAYVKEHLRPLCKSGVITAEQYRWAVGKTTNKVMKFHRKAKNASFLIKEGERVKKLALQYVEAAQEKDS